MKKPATKLIAPFVITRWLFGFALLGWGLTPVVAFLARERLFQGFVVYAEGITLTHLYVLGWLTTTAMAALHQLIPVIFEVPIRSSRVEIAGILLWIPGVSLLVAGMWVWRPAWLAVGGTLAVTGLLLFLTNFLLSLKEAKDRRFFGPFVYSAFGYLLVVVGIGLWMSLAFYLVLPFNAGRWLVLHAWIGGAGWFLTLVFGISYKLLPLFGVAGKQKPPYSRLVLGLIHLSVLAGFIAWLGWVPWLPAGLLLLGATGFHLADIRAMGGKRAGKNPGATEGFVRAGQLHLVLVALGVVAGLAFPEFGREPRSHAAIGLLVLGGWLSNTTAGYLHRILPFLVWHEQNREATDRITSLRALLSQPWAWWGWGTYNAGLLLLVAAIAFAARPLLWPGLALLAVGTWAVAANLALVFVRPPVYVDPMAELQKQE